MRNGLIGRSALSLAVVLASSGAASAISITFDYTYDTANFFSGPNVGRRSLLAQAASTFTPFTDSLSAITPGTAPSNQWTAAFFNPADPDGATVQVQNRAVAAGELVIYVGGYDFTDSTLGLGGPGGFGYSGANAGFADAVANRGQGVTSGASATDFGRWGGSLTFDTTANWNFGIGNPSFNQADLLSVAIHEIAHVLGAGLSDSWDADTTGGFHNGAAVVANKGGAVAVTTDEDHFANGTMSVLPGSGTAQEVSMDPSILLGSRKLFTTLDYAGMKDIGWEVPNNLLVVPEPTSAALLLAAAGLVLGRRRRA